MGWGWNVKRVCSCHDLGVLLSDQVVNWLEQKAKALRNTEAREHITLMYAICAYMLYVAKADGVVDKNERALIIEICMELDQEVGVGLSREDFSNLLELASGSRRAIPRLLELARSEDGLRYSLLRYGWRVAARDGRITEDEFEKILALGGEMKATNQELVGSSAPYYRAGNDFGIRRKALRTLNLGSKATQEEVDGRYRELCEKYSPNNYSNLSDDLMALVVEKYAIIRNAYKALISPEHGRKLYAKAPGKRQAFSPKKGSEVECYFCATAIVLPKAGLDKVHWRCASCQALLFFEADLSQIFLQGSS